MTDPTATVDKDRVRTWAHHRSALRAARSILASAGHDELVRARLATCTWLLDITAQPSGQPPAGLHQADIDHHLAVGYQWAGDLNRALTHGAVASMPTRVRDITARVDAIEWALALISPDDDQGVTDG